MRVPIRLLAVVGLAPALMAAAPVAPPGPLPTTIRPTAYDINLTVDPAKPEFAGEVTITAMLSEPTPVVYLHGRDLNVAKVTVTAGTQTIEGRYTQVDPTGVARLDFPRAVAAGPVSLRFKYTAAFRSSAEGLFRDRVGGDWFAWTQMQPIDARRMFPGFDEPGFKTPFAVTINAPIGAKVFANAPEIDVRPGTAGMTVHRFATTKPLPTYLVALGVGPFDVFEGQIPANAVRATALPFRVITTPGKTAQAGLAITETPKLLELLEIYFGLPYPYEKLDFITSPVMAGGMENPGLIVYGDSSLLLGDTTAPERLGAFGSFVAHELAHQWFGDLVTPTWWTDLWLNESFASWMGNRIADAWRPDVSAPQADLAGVFQAMDIDAQSGGRPIRQPITANNMITGAFDQITYRKGGQVLAMFEQYVGANDFRKGVRAYLRRFAHGNASADDFFDVLAAESGHPDVVPAMRSFVDQIGVPLVKVLAEGGTVRLRQSPYVPVGVPPGNAMWSIPVCVGGAGKPRCLLLDAPEDTIPGTAAVLPNAGATGYYRFSLDAAGWAALTARAVDLPSADAMAFGDSLWADFTAGRATFKQVLAGVGALSRHPDWRAATFLADRLSRLSETMLTPEDLPRYRKAIVGIFRPRLSELGYDVSAGRYAQEAPNRHVLRRSLVSILALYARDPAVTTALTDSAVKYVNGDQAALDPVYRLVALQTAVQVRGLPFVVKLREDLTRTTNPQLREQIGASLAFAGAGEPLRVVLDAIKTGDLKRREAYETMSVLLHRAETRRDASKFALENFEMMLGLIPDVSRGRIVLMFDGFCSDADAEDIDAALIAGAIGTNSFDLERGRVKSGIRSCAALKALRGGQVSAALKAATW